jgi:serine protease AprX
MAKSTTKPKALPIPAPLVDLVLLGPVDDRRQLQDSPILGDVWMAYAANPAAVQDLLMTPHKRSTAGAVASHVARRLAESKIAREGSHQIAYLQGLVAVRLDLVELLKVIVPMTHWWTDRKIPAAIAKYSEPALKKHLRELFMSIEVVEGNEARPHREFPPLERYLALAGLLLWAKDHGDAQPPVPEALTPAAVSTSIIQLVIKDIDAFYRGLISVYDEIRSSKPKACDALIFQVSLNRRVSPAIARSVPAVKGDAARTLFKVNTSKIAWAILDSGIAQDHRAFLDGDPKIGKDKNAKATAPKSRVVRTFDFTRMRQIACIDNRSMPSADFDALVNDVGASAAQVRKWLKQMSDNAVAGGKIEWEIAEKLLAIQNPPPPVSAHGTHVAGIIGARKPTTEGENDFADGMCPDIQLYDFRVLAKTTEDTEFAVIAALQYIRYVNERHSYVTIHGANLSLSIPHNVRNYACGRTPVCNECQRLVESGVVVVAAAGNRGYQKFETKDGLFENYAAFSITDPGNAEDVITVGATHGNWPHTYGVSFFSSRGPTGDGRPKPDLVAPGERISAPIPGNEMGAESGTSMAAPHVSGAAAMLMARYPELIGNPRRIKRILIESATDLDRDRSFQGRGMLDVLRAFQSI